MHMSSWIIIASLQPNFEFNQTNSSVVRDNFMFHSIIELQLALSRFFFCFHQLNLHRNVSNVVYLGQSCITFLQDVLWTQIGRKTEFNTRQ